MLHFSGEVAKWLAPRTSSANREDGGSSLTVSTDDPLGVSVIDALLRVRAYNAAPRFTQPNVHEICIQGLRGPGGVRGRFSLFGCF